MARTLRRSGRQRRGERSSSMPGRGGRCPAKGLRLPTPPLNFIEGVCLMLRRVMHSKALLALAVGATFAVPVTALGNDGWDRDGRSGWRDIRDDRSDWRWDRHRDMRDDRRDVRGDWAEVRSGFREVAQDRAEVRDD